MGYALRQQPISGMRRSARSCLEHDWDVPNNVPIRNAFRLVVLVGRGRRPYMIERTKKTISWRS
jgi:hypothetical protein